MSATDWEQPTLRATVLPPDVDEAVAEHLPDGLVKLATAVLAKTSDVTSALIEPARQGAWFVVGTEPAHRQLHAIERAPRDRETAFVVRRDEGPELIQ